MIIGLGVDLIDRTRAERRFPRSDIPHDLSTSPSLAVDASSRVSNAGGCDAVS
jgi:hypothetical protein